MGTEMSVRIRNTSAAEAPPPQPMKADGSEYTYEVVDGWWRIYGDEHAELIAELIPSYSGTLEDREAFARAAAARLQATLAAEGPFGGCTAAEREAILADRARPPSAGHWSAAVPLVLVTTHCPPPRPTGNIVWIDPTDESTLLSTLGQAGFVQVRPV
ncbi:hypothetical protein FXF51_21940 [Nonomuraea sp. PA05]|uniref:hypothetical protein n=1 Tax=Nonomuraea sp. PA05 TaxID=2604466 RepID=UPI0011D2F2EA|nr:hypothetical protein [Nonomuraea sp. PA05]TYB64377.1 hypothetical protein FXF51_21940 [Nonomuraea sp. PA05]